MYEGLFDGLKLTEAEKYLIQRSDTAQTNEISEVKIVAELYNVKKTEYFIQNLIDSNEKLSTANSKYAKALNYLTGALVLVGIIQLFVK